MTGENKGQKAPIMGAAEWRNVEAPDLDIIRALAEAAFERLPDAVKAHCQDLLIRIEDFPDEELCAELGLETPFDILGLYQGVDLARRSSTHPPTDPDLVYLFRRPILDVWAEGGHDLSHVITHVLVHEIGHHVGLTDDDMEAIEAQAGNA